MQFDTSKLDQEGVKASQRGQNWDQNDQARYDKWAEAKDRTTEYTTGQEKIPQSQGGTGPEKPAQSQGKPDQPVYQTGKLNQDNDQGSTITGDKNYVYQNQDNSVRNYEGDDRSFTYNGSGDLGKDNIATMGTLAGVWAPSDSPSAKAKRLDQAVQMNRDNQKKYANTSHIAEGAIARAERNSYINPQSLDKRIAQREQYSRDKATVLSSQLFGDMGNFMKPDWKSADPAKPVEAPDFEKMYDKYAP